MERRGKEGSARNAEKDMCGKGDGKGLQIQADTPVLS